MAFQPCCDHYFGSFYCIPTTNWGCVLEQFSNVNMAFIYYVNNLYCYLLFWPKNVKKDAETVVNYINLYLRKMGVMDSCFRFWKAT